MWNALAVDKLSRSSSVSLSTSRNDARGKERRTERESNGEWVSERANECLATIPCNGDNSHVDNVSDVDECDDESDA